MTLMLIITYKPIFLWKALITTLSYRFSMFLYAVPRSKCLKSHGWFQRSPLHPCHVPTTFPILLSQPHPFQPLHPYKTPCTLPHPVLSVKSSIPEFSTLSSVSDSFKLRSLPRKLLRSLSGWSPRSVLTLDLPKQAVLRNRQVSTLRTHLYLRVRPLSVSLTSERMAFGRISGLVKRSCILPSSLVGLRGGEPLPVKTWMCNVPFARAHLLHCRLLSSSRIGRLLGKRMVKGAVSRGWPGSAG